MNAWNGPAIHQPYYPQPGMPGFSPEFPMESPPYMRQPYPPGSPQRPLFPQPHEEWEGRSPFQGLQKLFKRRSRRSFLLAHQMANALGQPVEVATYAGEVKGEVAGVYPDHLLIRREEKKYHVRWEGIVYVCPSEEK